MNLIPLLPVKGASLGAACEPSAEAVAAARRSAAAHLRQLSHCSRCRADAAGFPGADVPAEATVAEDAAAAEGGPPRAASRPIMVAVASREGLLVNRHVGEAERLYVFRLAADGRYAFVEARPTPGEGSGPARWEELAALISDCSILLAAGVGAPPRRILEDRGVTVHVLEGLIEEALRAIAEGWALSFLTPRAACASGCSGGAKRGCGCA
jgi:nitrogen fixation protein NifB